MGAYGVTQGVLRLPIGIAADRWHWRREVVIAGLLAAGLGALVLALAPGPAGLVFGRILSGAGAACWVALLVLAVGTYPGRLTDAMTAVAVVATLAEAGAVLAGGFLAELLGWTAPFYASIVLAAAGLVPALRLRSPAAADGEPASWDQIVHIATRPRLLLVSAVTALVTLTIYVTTYGFVPILALERGATRADVGILATLAQGGFALGAVVSGRAARRVPLPLLLVAGAGLVALSAALVPVASAMPLLQLAQAIGGVGRGLVNPVAAVLVLSDVREAQRSTAMGVYQVGWSTGIVLGPPFAGWIAERAGLDAAFLAGTAASIVAAALGGWLWLRDRRP